MKDSPNAPNISGYRKQIEHALEYAGGTSTFEDVCQAVEEGRLQFWPGPHSVVISEVAVYPRAKVLILHLAGGCLSEIEAMTPVLEQFARDAGCTRVVLHGRKGWERTFLTRIGFRPTQVVFEKTLDG